MPYKIWRDLNEEQRAVWRAGFAGASEDWYLAREFWIKPDGATQFHRALVRQAPLESLCAGLNDADRETLLRIIRGDDVRSKGDLAGFKTATFHLAPERPR